MVPCVEQSCVLQWAGRVEGGGRQWAVPVGQSIVRLGLLVEVVGRPMGARMGRVWWDVGGWT